MSLPPQKTPVPELIVYFYSCQIITPKSLFVKISQAAAKRLRGKPFGSVDSIDRRQRVFEYPDFGFAPVDEHELRRDEPYFFGEVSNQESGIQIIRISFYPSFSIPNLF
jgi:hypothetical protein